MDKYISYLRANAENYNRMKNWMKKPVHIDISRAENAHKLVKPLKYCQGHDTKAMNELRKKRYSSK